MSSEDERSALEGPRTVLRIQRQGDHLDKLVWMVGEYMKLEAVRNGAGKSFEALAQARNTLGIAAHHLRSAAALVADDLGMAKDDPARRGDTG